MIGEKSVEQLIADGLNYFGVGEVERAVECWEHVLRLEPGNELARDYLADARPGSGEAAAPGVELLLADAKRLLERDQLEEALDHFQLGARLDPGRAETELYVDLLRAHLLRRYRQRLGGLATRPTLRLDRAAIARYNLSADAGFLLSRLDGATNLDELISLSGMNAFEALQILDRLCRAGIVEMAT